MTIIGRLADSPEIVPTSTGQDIIRSLVYVEGDCSMNKFTDKEGKPQNVLRVVQRRLATSCEPLCHVFGNNKSESHSSRRWVLEASRDLV
ncbi:MAG: hypothetical protein Q9217_005133 [Psora testacea]